MGAMSRLRRLGVSDRWPIVTCRLLPRGRILSASEFACLAHGIHERRTEHGIRTALARAADRFVSEPNNSAPPLATPLPVEAVIKPNES